MVWLTLKLNWYAPVVLSELQWTKETHDSVFPPAIGQVEGQENMSQTEQISNCPEKVNTFNTSLGRVNTL